MKFKARKSKWWNAINPILEEGEPGYDKTTKQFKVGDGVTPWSDLPYYAAGGGGGGGGGGAGSGTTVNLRPLFSEKYALPEYRICGDIAIRDHDDFCIAAISFTIDAYDESEGLQAPISFQLPEELCPSKYAQLSGIFTDAQQVRHPAYAAIEAFGDLTFQHLQDGSYQGSLTPLPGQTVALNFFGTFLRYMPNNEDS